MGSITIHDLDDGLAARLRSRAAVHGRSVEEEARDILQASLADPGPAARPPIRFDDLRGIARGANPDGYRDREVLGIEDFPEAVRRAEAPEEAAAFDHEVTP